MKVSPGRDAGNGGYRQAAATVTPIADAQERRPLLTAPIVSANNKGTSPRSSHARDQIVSANIRPRPPVPAAAIGKSGASSYGLTNLWTGATSPTQLEISPCNGQSNQQWSLG